MAIGQGMPLQDAQRRLRASSPRSFLDKRTLLIAAWALAAVPALIHKPKQFFSGFKGRETPWHEQAINNFQPKPEPSMFSGVFGAPQPTQSSVPAPLVGALVIGTLIGVMSATGALKNLTPDEFKFEAPSLSLPSFAVQAPNEVSSLFANDAMASDLEIGQALVSERSATPIMDFSVASNATQDLRKTNVESVGELKDEMPTAAKKSKKRKSFFANLKTKGSAFAATISSGEGNE